MSVVCALSFFSVIAGGFVAHYGIGSTSLLSNTQAQDNRATDSRRCSPRTLKGAYGIKFDGRKVSGEPIASIARITFDGAGVFTTNEIGRLNGNVIQRTFTGPYTVNEDCMGFIDFSSNLTNPPHEVHGDFIVVDEGREFFLLDNEEGWAASGVGKKL
jgi:hypothetical protein